MKKLFFLLLILLTIIDVIYASFPVTETEHTEFIEYNIINNLPIIWIGFLVGILSWVLFPLNLLLPIFIRDRSFRRSVFIGMIMGLLLLIVIIVVWLIASGSGLTIM